MCSLHTLSLSLCCSCCLFPLHTYVHTCTRTHNGCSKFFQGISRLINRLVVWGSSEVQGSRLNPLTGRIISGRWVHTSPVAPHKPLPSWLDLWQNKPPPPPTHTTTTTPFLPVLLTPAAVNAPERGRDGARGREATIGYVLEKCHPFKPTARTRIYKTDQWDSLSTVSLNGTWTIGPQASG